MNRLLEVLRFARPYMLVASAMCFLIAALIGGPFPFIAESLWHSERILLSVGWAAWAGFLYVVAYLIEEIEP